MKEKSNESHTPKTYGATDTPVTEENKGIKKKNLKQKIEESESASKNQNTLIKPQENKKNVKLPEELDSSGSNPDIL